MNRVKRITALLLSLLMCFSLLDLTAFAADSDTAEVQVDVTFCQTEARSELDMVNDFRTGSDAWAWDSSDSEKVYYSDLSELTYDYALEQVAMQRCVEIALSFSHTRTNGENCFTAYDDAGYSYSYAGENIAVGYSSAEAVFAGWQESNASYSGQGHRRNMLSSHYNRFASACVYYDGAYFWVQEFAYSTSSVAYTEPNDSQTRANAEILTGKTTVSSISASPASLTIVNGKQTALPEVTAYITLSTDGWHDDPYPVIPTCTCSVGDTSVVTVDGETVTAQTIGSTTLTLSALGKTVSVPVTVTVATPTLASVANSASGVTVKWNAVDDAEGYFVYRKTSGGRWSKLKGTTATSYTDTTAESGTTYYYTVRAKCGSTLSGYDKTGLSIVRLSQPTVTLANSASGVTVKWSKVSGASSYYVCRKTSGGSWTKLTGTTSTSYTDTTAESGTTYYYTVRAKSGSSLSSYDSSKSIVRLSTPTLSSATASSGKITVKWAAVTGASGYYVYRKTSGGSWTKLKGTSSTSYADTSVKSGTTYYYTVRAAKGSTLSAYNTTGVSAKAK